MVEALALVSDGKCDSLAARIGRCGDGHCLGRVGAVAMYDGVIGRLCERYEDVAIGIICYIVFDTNVFYVGLYLRYIMRVGCDGDTFHWLIIKYKYKIAYDFDKLMI